PDWAFAGAVGLAAAALPFMLWTGAIERRRARAGVPHWLTWRRALVSAGSGFGLLGLVTATHAALRQLGIGPAGTLVASGVPAEFVGAADGAQLAAVRETARDDGAIIDAVDRLSKRLRERIGESLKTIRSSDPLERVTTSSLVALQRYSQAVKASEAGEWDR